MKSLTCVDTECSQCFTRGFCVKERLRKIDAERSHRVFGSFNGGGEEVNGRYLGGRAAMISACVGQNLAQPIVVEMAGGMEKLVGIGGTSRGCGQVGVNQT